MLVQVAGENLFSPQDRWVNRFFQINFGSAVIKVSYKRGMCMLVLSLMGDYLSK
jgi:hypothetical protein